MDTTVCKTEIKTPRFSEITTPRVLCIIIGNGGGSKLIQSYIDGHPSFYNIPAYPLIYLYPHWQDWAKELTDSWRWETILDKFCEKHASVLDSRRIPGFNGLDTLGESKDEHIAIDENVFRAHMMNLLEDQPISRRTFILAVNYAYALCNGEDLSVKTVFLWHHHHFEHLDDFRSDFPDATIFGSIRDARPVVFRCYDALIKVDEGKLNETDAMIYRSILFENAIIHTFYRIDKIASYVDLDHVYLIRHEDLKLRLKELMEKICSMFDVPFQESMLDTTFGGKAWWGHAIYNMPQVRGTYKRVLSKDWQKALSKIEIFVYEGIYLDFYKKYGYRLLYYKKDHFWNLLLLRLAILSFDKIEQKDLWFYLNPKNHIRFLKAAAREAYGKIELKDYTWNATYLYKWTYVKLKLWKRKWLQEILEYAHQMTKKDNRNVFQNSIIFLCRMIYIILKYLRFWRTIIMLPVQFLRRTYLFYKILSMRLNRDIRFPRLFNEEFDLI